MTSRNQTTIRTRLLCAASIVSVVTMAGCATIAAKMRRTPVQTNPVRIAQSNDDMAVYDESEGADADDTVRNTPSGRAADVMADVAHKGNDDPSVVPDVNLYGEFDGFQRML